MTLYAANVMDVAKPIEKKQKRAKKAVEPVPAEPVVEEEVREPLKELTPKQVAAAERRKRKRDELEAAKQAEEEAIRAKQAEIEAKEEELARKKEEAKERRRLAREAKKAVAQEATPASTESEASSENLVEQKAAPKKRKRDDSEPPAWFQKYVAGVKQEEAKQAATKVPKRQVEEQARTVAQEQWKDGLTRDRVQNEVDGHMSRMYGMIFGHRRLK